MDLEPHPYIQKRSSLSSIIYLSLIIRTVYDDFREGASAADSSAPQRHARAWACGDRSWDTIQDYGPPVLSGNRQCSHRTGWADFWRHGWGSGCSSCDRRRASRPGVTKGGRRQVVRKMIMAGSSSTAAFHKYGIL